MTDTYNLKDECWVSAFSLALSIAANNPELASKLSDLAEQANEAALRHDALKEWALKWVEWDVWGLAHEYSLKSESADMKFKAVLFWWIFDKTAQWDEALRIIADEIMNTGGTVSEGIELFRLIDETDISSLNEIAKIMTEWDMEAAKQLVEGIRTKLSYYIWTDYSIVRSGSQIKLNWVIKEYQNKINIAKKKIESLEKKLSTAWAKTKNLFRWLDSDLKKLKWLKANTIEWKNELSKLWEKYGVSWKKDLKKKLEKKLTDIKKAKEDLDAANKTKAELEAAQEYKDALNWDMRIIQDGGNPINLMSWDEEWKFLKSFETSPSGRAQKYWQYVLARAILTWWKDLPQEVIDVIKSSIDWGAVNYLDEHLTEDWIMAEDRTLEELLARAYTNTVDLANDWQLRNIYRQRLMELASDSEISVKDVDYIEALINTLKFSEAGAGFSSVLKYTYLVRAANNLGLDIPASQWDELWNSIVNLFKKKEKDFWRAIMWDFVKLWNGVEMTTRQLLELVAEMLWNTNINKLIVSDTLTDREILDIAWKYLIWDAKAGGNRIVELIQAAKNAPTTDDTRGIILKTITWNNVPKESKVGFFDFRRGLRASPEVKARANFMERLANANTLNIPNGSIYDLTDNLEQRISEYKWGFILVNDAQWKMNKRLTDAIDRVNHNADGTPVKAEERVTVIYPEWGLMGTITTSNWKIIYRTSDTASFNKLVRNLAIRTLWQSDIDTRFTKELQDKLLAGDVDAIAEYNRLLEEDAKKYFWEMLWIREEAYDEKLVPMLQELTGISFKNYDSIVDKVSFWRRIDDNFILWLKTVWNLDQEFITVGDIIKEIDALTPKQMASRLSDMFDLEIKADMITEGWKIKDEIRDAYLNYQLAQDPIELLWSKWKLLAILNWWVADDITVSQFKAMLQSWDFSSYKDIFFHNLDLTDEELDKHIKSINDMIYNSLSAQLAMNLVKMWYRLPMVNIRDLVYDYLMDKLNVNWSFARAFLFKNWLPDTLEALRGVINEGMPKELRFGYDDWYKFDVASYDKEARVRYTVNDGYDRLWYVVESRYNKNTGHTETILSDWTILIDWQRLWWEVADWMNLTDSFLEIYAPSVVNWKTVRDLAQEYNIPLFIAQDSWLANFSKTSLWRTNFRRWEINWKTFVQTMINLRRTIPEGTASHELFHAVFLTLAPDETKYFIDQAKKLYKLNDREANEMLADLFSEYFRTWSFTLPNAKKLQKDASFRAWIIQWFQKISNWLVWIDWYEAEVANLFDDILSWKLKTTTKQFKKWEIEAWNKANVQQWKDYLVNIKKQQDANRPAGKVATIVTDGKANVKNWENSLNGINAFRREVVINQAFNAMQSMYKALKNGTASTSTFDERKDFWLREYELEYSNIDNETKAMRWIMHKFFSKVSEGDIEKIKNTDDFKNFILDKGTGNDLTWVYKLKKRVETIDNMYIFKNADATKKLEAAIKAEYWDSYRVIAAKGNLYIWDANDPWIDTWKVFSSIDDIERLFDVYNIPHKSFQEIYNRLKFYPSDADDVNKLLQTELDSWVMWKNLSFDWDMNIDTKKFFKRFDNLTDEQKVTVFYRLETFMDLMYYTSTQENGRKLLDNTFEMFFPDIAWKIDTDKLWASLRSLHDNLDNVVGKLMKSDNVIKSWLVTTPLINIKYTWKPLKKVVKEIYDNWYFPYEFNIVTNSRWSVQEITLWNPFSVWQLSDWDYVYHSHPNSTFFSWKYLEWKGSDLKTFMNNFRDWASKNEWLILPWWVIVTFKNDSSLWNTIDYINNRTSYRNAEWKPFLWQTVYVLALVSERLWQMAKQEWWIFDNVIKKNDGLIKRILNGSATEEEKNALYNEINSIALEENKRIVDENLNRFIPRWEDRAYLMEWYNRPNTYTDPATWIKYELSDRDYRELYWDKEVITELVPIEELDRLKDVDRRLVPKWSKEDSNKTIDELKESFQKDWISTPVQITYSVKDNRAYLSEWNHRLAAAKELWMKYLPTQVYVLKTTDAWQWPTMRRPTPFRVGNYYPDRMSPTEIWIKGVRRNTDGFDRTWFSRPKNTVTPWYSKRIVERDNPYVSDTYSSLIAMASVKNWEALPTLWMEEEMLAWILRRYYDDIAAATKGGKRLSFSDAQKKKTQAWYALDMFEQDYIMPRYKQFLTPNERSELMWLKYWLAVATDENSLRTIEDYNDAILSRYKNATNNIITNNTIFSAWINSDININKEVEERQKQLLEQWATLKYVNWQIVITDIREDLLRELNNIPNTILWLENLKALWRNWLAQMSNESVYFLLNVVQLAKNMENKTNLIMQTIYKVNPRLAKIDFFNTYKAVDWVPYILRDNLLSSSKKLSKYQNTMWFDTETKKTILSKIKETFIREWRINDEQLRKIVDDSITENFKLLSNSIKGIDKWTFKKQAKVIYTRAFVPYTYLLDVPKEVKNSIANIIAEQQKWIRLATSLLWGEDSILGVMDNISIYTMDGTVKSFRDVLEWKQDDINKILFWTDDEIIMAADVAEQSPTGWKMSRRARRKKEKDNADIAKAVENNYRDWLNAYLNESEIVSEAERKLLNTTMTAARQVAKKYTSTNRIAETDNALASINEEIIRRFKADVLWFGWKLSRWWQRWDFWWRIQDWIMWKWDSVKDRYKYYYSMDIDQLNRMRSSNPIDTMAIYLAKYFKEIETRLGSLDWITWVTTDMAINRAFWHIWEVVLNVKTINWLYSLMSGIEWNQILKFFRFSNPKQASYVKKFVIGWEWKETVGWYRTYVDNTDEWLDRDWFNKTFATNFSQPEYQKIVQALTGFTIVSRKWKKMESALNFINSSNYVFRVLMSYPWQILTIANQSIAYFLRQRGWEDALWIEDLWSIDEIRKKTGILNGTYNEINWFNWYSPDDVDPTSFYNRYWIPDVENVYKNKKFYSTDDIETIFAKIDEYNSGETFLDKASDFFTKVLRNTDAYKDNANNIIDWIFARNFKNVAFVRAIQNNQVMRFNTAEQFARFMASWAPESMKKRLLDAVTADSGKHFRNILWLGFSWLDRAVSWGNKIFPAWASNIVVWLTQLFNFRWAWWQNIARQTNNFFVTALKMGKMWLTKEWRDWIALFLARQPEFVNFAQQLFNDLKYSWRLVRFQDNWRLPDENDEWSWLDFIDYAAENMKFASQWRQGIQSYWTTRIITEWWESVLKSHAQPDIYKDTWWVWAFFNALAKNAWRNWKVPKFAMNAVAQWMTNWSDAFWEYLWNEWWKLSFGTLRYLMNEDYTSYWYSTEMPRRQTGIPFIITWEINAEWDKAFSYDLANTEVRENITNWYDAKKSWDTEAANIYAMNLWDTAFNSSQFLGTIKWAWRAINGSSLVWDTIKWWMDDMHFYKASNPFDLAEAWDLIAETEAWEAMQKYWYYIPSQSTDVQTFIDTIIWQSDFRPGNEWFNKSFFNFDNSGHMQNLKESNKKDAAMEMLLTNMKYKRDENRNFVLDENWQKIVTDYWKTHMDEIERKINDADFLVNSNFNFIYNWVEQNNTDPNYMLYKKLIWEWLAWHYLEEKVNEHIAWYNNVYWLKKTEKLTLTELKNSELYDVVIPAMKSWHLVTKNWDMPFLEALATLDENALREADIKIVERQLWQLWNQDAIKKFFNVNEKWEVSLTTKYEEFLEEQWKLSSYLRAWDLDSFLAETASITKVFKKDDPYGLMTTTLLWSRVNQINNSNYLSAEQKAKAINVLFTDNAEFIQQHIPELISELWDVAEVYIDQMNDSLYGSSLIADKLITDNEMNNSSSWRKAAKSASDKIKAVIVDLAKAAWDTGKIWVKRYNYNFTPVQLNWSKLLNIVWWKWYSPETPSLVVSKYTPHADFSVAKDINRSVKWPKTETISKKKQLSKLEEDVTKALEAE